MTKSPVKEYVNRFLESMFEADLSNEYKSLSRTHKSKMICDMNELGAPQSKIAKSLGVSQPTVSLRLKTYVLNQPTDLSQPRYSALTSFMFPEANLELGLDEYAVKDVFRSIINNKMYNSTATSLEKIDIEIEPNDFEIYLQINLKMKELRQNVINRRCSLALKEFAEEATKNTPQFMPKKKST